MVVGQSYECFCVDVLMMSVGLKRLEVESRDYDASDNVARGR